MKIVKLVLGITLSLFFFIALRSELHAQAGNHNPTGGKFNADGKIILQQQSNAFPAAPAAAECQDSWSLVSSLYWGVVADWDLHLQTPNAHIYYQNRTADGFTLDRDAYPNCSPAPPAPERITGNGQCGTYRLYSNLYSTCGGSPPITFIASVTVLEQITINGVGYNPGQTFNPQDGVPFTVAANPATIEITIDNPPTDQIYRIGPEPSMPQILARAKVVGITPDPTANTTFTWTLSVHYDSSETQPGPNSRRIIDYSWSATTTGNTGNAGLLHTDFQDIIRGGHLTLTARATLNGQLLTSPPLTNYKILGLKSAEDNQTPHNLRAILRNSTVRKIARQESIGGHQFRFDGNVLWNDNGQGGSDGGVGVMQVSPVYGANGQIIRLPTDDEVWDWRKNAAMGVVLFKAKRDSAQRLRGHVQDKVTRLVNQDRAKQHPPKNPITIVVPPLTTHGGNLVTFDQEFEGVSYDDNLNQVEQDAVRLNNGAAGTDVFGPGLHEFQISRIPPQTPLFVEDDATIERTGVATVIWRHVLVQERPSSTGDPNYVHHVLDGPDLP